MNSLFYFQKKFSKSFFRLLITAPSNSASDLIALRLIDSGVLKPGDLIRLISYNYATSDAIPPQLVPYCATGSIAKDGTGSNNEFTENGISFGKKSRKLSSLCYISMFSSCFDLMYDFQNYPKVQLVVIVLLFLHVRRQGSFSIWDFLKGIFLIYWWMKRHKLQNQM